MILSGVMAILGGVILLVAGVIFAAADMGDPGEVASVFGNYAWVGLVVTLIGGAFQVFTGIYSRKNAMYREKANLFIYFGLIAAVLHFASQIIGYINIHSHTSFDTVGVLVGMVIPAFYIISAVQLKKEEEEHKERIPELSVLRNFLVKNKERIFEILFTLIICGVIGWAFETTEVWIHYGRLTARGMLFISRIGDFPILWGLPFILMYGIGGAILIWCFKPLAKEPIRLFFIGTFVLTIFEYATSVFCENVLNMKLWDYSDVFMNFQGRICLTSSLAWGVLSVVSVKFLAPLFDKLYNEIMNKRVLHVIILVLLVFIVVCYLLRPILNVEQY